MTMEDPSQERSGGWEVVYKHSGVYTGGHVEISPDGSSLVCLCSDNIAVLYVDSGHVRYKLREEDNARASEEDDAVEVAQERFTAFAIHPSGKFVTTCSDSRLLRHWELGEASAVLKKSWKGPESPVLCAAYHALGDLYATGASDASVKVWSVSGGFCTHNFRGHKSIITALRFHPNPQCLHLFTADNGGGLRRWSLLNGKGEKSIDPIYRKFSTQHSALEAHYSGVSCLAFCKDGGVLLSGGRDKVIGVWSVGYDRPFLVRTIPVYESIEGLSVLPVENGKEDEVRFVTAGENGVLRLWKLSLPLSPGSLKSEEALRKGPEPQCLCLATQERRGGDKRDPYLNMVLSAAREELVVSTGENYLRFVKVDGESFLTKKTIVGYNDDIIDVEYIPSMANDDGREKRIALATNSSEPQIVDLQTYNSTLLEGHTAIVLCVSASSDGCYLATASRDNSCRLWDTSTGDCVGTCNGHTEAVTSVGFVDSKGLQSRLATGKPIVISASADRTIKCWTLSGKRKVDGNSGEQALCSSHTEVGHSKTINALAISPNKAFVATASQDKTVKLWRIEGETVSLRTTLAGHKRGVWSVAFSPVDKCLMSCSADKTLRLWSATDFSCVSIFEGSESSVIRLKFFPDGKRVVSGSSNGVLKVWSVKKTECIGTLEHHRDRVWAIAVSNDGTQMITGASDGQLARWEDHAEELADKQKAKEEEEILKEEEMIRLERGRKLVPAALRALELNRPYRLRKILKQIVAVDPDKVATFIYKLSAKQHEQCWEIVKEWNTMASSAQIAQYMIAAMLRCNRCSLNTTLQVDKLVQPIISYSQRHNRRLDRVMQSTYLLDHALVCMNHNLKDDASSN